MRYRYLGPGPHDDGEGGVVRPGEVRGYPAMPDWGPWVLVPESPAEPPAVHEPAPAPESPAAAGEAAQATASEPGEE